MLGIIGIEKRRKEKKKKEKRREEKRREEKRREEKRREEKRRGISPEYNVRLDKLLRGAIQHH